MYVDFSLDQRMDTFLRMHARAFAFLGGVPKKVIYDNLKSSSCTTSGASSCTTSGQPCSSTQPSSPSRDMLFEPVAAPVRYPQAKGNVENAIKYIRTSFFYGRSFHGIDDDPSAHLRLVSTKGGAPVDLDNASQRTSQWPMSSTWTNSWPRFAPPSASRSQPSTFQGKTLYWVAFSSRLPYGATLQGSQDGSTPPQIWFAAIAVDPSGELSADPSFAPVWLPLQNSATPEILLDGGVSQTLGGNGTPTGNHIPQWVYTYVPYKPPPPRDGGYLPPPP